MSIRIVVFSILSFVLGATVSLVTPPAVSFVADPSDASFGSAVNQDDRAADRAAIRAHIESIFQAFIDWDVDKIYATHSQDWRGFLDETRKPIKGIDEYMRANGIDWPKVKGSKPQPDPNRSYRISDFDVIFHSPELAVVNFIGEMGKKSGGDFEPTYRMRIMDVYGKREGNWIQVASHTVADPAWQREQMSQPMTINPRIRERILTAREAVWKAWFGNDQAALEKLIPDEAIAINDGQTEWANKTAILASAKGFAGSGGKLVRLEFPKTEMQVYGNTVVIYTTYLYETEMNGKRSTQSGRGTEIFVRRGDELINSGWHLDSRQ